MHDKLSVSLIMSLFLLGCGLTYNQDVFVDKSLEKAVLLHEFGSIFEGQDKKFVVIAPKQLILHVLKKMSEKYKHGYTIIYDRKSASIEYTADKLYKILIHPGLTTKINEISLSLFEAYSLIEFSNTETVSPQFRQQLMDAFKEEQLQHDPHEHINGVYTTNLNTNDARGKLDQFFKKLYPTAKFKTEIVHGKVYAVVSVHRGGSSSLESLDNIYYFVKDQGYGQSLVQLHSRNASSITQDEIVSKQESQEILDTIVQKLGF